MKEYLKNGNEYLLDGKRYVETIRRCRCEKKFGDQYVLTCRIHQRGEHDYHCSADPTYLARDGEKKKLWLSEAAKAVVLPAIEAFDNALRAIDGTEYTEVAIGEKGFSLFFNHFAPDRLSVWLKYPDKSGVRNVLKEECSARELLNKAGFEYWMFHDEDSEVSDAVMCLPKEAPEKNPIYRAAGETGDRVLQMLLKLYHGAASAEECEALSAVLGYEILPPLPAAYDKVYAVKKDRSYYPLLQQSGYCIMHRPYFSMRGYTQEVWQLNPHRKKGVDAAPKGGELISFEEYLALFGRSEE